MKFKAILVFVLMASVSNIHAQKIVRSSLNAFGNVALNNHFMLSQTVGQSSNHSVFYSESSEIELRQGFQQAHYNAKIAKSNQLKFALYPNPNNGQFSITMQERINGELQYRLIDNQGRIHQNGKLVTNGTNHFNFTLPSGSYILQLKSPEGKSGIAKIIILP